MSNDQSAKSKLKRKSKLAEDVLDEKLDAMLESASKLADRTATISKEKIMAETASGWSNNTDYNDDSGDDIKPPLIIQRGTRRAGEEIIASDIPTIPMDDADGDDGIDITPQVAVAPEFSLHQIASFKEMEKEFFRERASQYIDSKIDIGILYHHLNLQEDIDTEEQKIWDYDKLLVEIRNAISNPITDLNRN